MAKKLSSRFFDTLALMYELITCGKALIGKRIRLKRLIIEYIFMESNKIYVK